MAKTKSHPTTKRRKRKQNQRAKLGRIREQLQLRGEEPTSAEGAVRCERVDPSTQEEQELTALDRQAVRRGWAVPEAEKVKVIDRLLDVVKDPLAKNMAVIFSANALVSANHRQYEYDNPEAAGKAKGGVKVDVANQVNVVADPWQLYQKALEESKDDPVEARIEQELQGGTEAPGEAGSGEKGGET